MARLSNREVDLLVETEYLEALGRGEQWALDAFKAQRRAESAER